MTWTKGPTTIFESSPSPASLTPLVSSPYYLYHQSIYIHIQVLGTSSRPHCHNSSLSHRHFCLSLWLCPSNWPSCFSFLNMTTRDTQLHAVRTSPPPTFCDSSYNTVRVRVLSHSPYVLPLSCSYPLDGPTLFAQPLWCWAPQCSLHTVNPLQPSLKGAHSAFPVQGRPLLRKEHSFLSHLLRALTTQPPFQNENCLSCPQLSLSLPGLAFSIICTTM